MSKEIRTKERAGCLLEQKACIPSVGQMRCGEEPKRTLSSCQGLAIQQDLGRAISKILQDDGRTDNSGGRRRVWRDCKPFIESATLIRLKVRITDPADRCGIEQTADSIPCDGKCPAESGMVEKWLLVTNEVLIEAEAEVRVRTPRYERCPAQSHRWSRSFPLPYSGSSSSFVTLSMDFRHRGVSSERRFRCPPQRITRPDLGTVASTTGQGRQ